MLSEKHARGIEDRGLCLERAADMGLYSARRCPDGSIVPDINGNILAFPYYEEGVEVNTKYRWSDKGRRCFQQRKGGVKTVYNADVLLDKGSLNDLFVGQCELIWTEGEFDCLAILMCGYHHVISVPEGALPARDAAGKLIHVPDDDHDIDPENDDKFAFMLHLEGPLLDVKKHIIATDADEPGQRLAKELVRRLGAAKCHFVEYPKDEVVPDKKNPGHKRACKDMNEVKLYLGELAVQKMIAEAKPWPVKGLFRLSDYPDQEIPTMAEAGLSPELDELIKFYPGQFGVWTGFPNAGKSTLINQISVLMARRHKWPVAIFSGEKEVKPFLALELMTAFLEKPKKEWTPEDKKRATAFVERYYQFIDYDEGADYDISVKFVIETLEVAVFRDGVRFVILDPWNELEHERPMNLTLTEYVGKAIKKFKRFCKQYGVSLHVVAHPKMMDQKTTPGLYSISDSAHWANKPDLGVVIVADDEENEYARTIVIPKVRMKRIAGNTGAAKLMFNPETGLFTRPDF